MSSLHPQSSFRLCRTCARSWHLSQSLKIRCLSQTSACQSGELNIQTVPDAQDRASMIEVAHKPEQTLAMPSSRQPNYRDPEIDHGTSTFSPVPKRVMDGSEPGETTPAAVVSGAPIDLQARTVRYCHPPALLFQQSLCN